MARKQIILKLSHQCTEEQAIGILKLFPDVDKVHEIEVPFSGQWIRKVFEAEGKIEKRKEVDK